MGELRDHLQDLLTDAVHEPACGERCVCLLDDLRLLIVGADLAELEATDPAVAAAARSYDEMSAEIRAKRVELAATHPQPAKCGYDWPNCDRPVVDTAVHHHPSMPVTPACEYHLREMADPAHPQTEETK